MDTFWLVWTSVLKERSRKFLTVKFWVSQKKAVLNALMVLELQTMPRNVSLWYKIVRNIKYQIYWRRLTHVWDVNQVSFIKKRKSFAPKVTRSIAWCMKLFQMIAKFVRIDTICKKEYVSLMTLFLLVKFIILK